MSHYWLNWNALFDDQNIAYNEMQYNDDWEMNKQMFLESLMIIYETHI